MGISDFADPFGEIAPDCAGLPLPLPAYCCLRSERHERHALAPAPPWPPDLPDQPRFIEMQPEACGSHSVALLFSGSHCSLGFGHNANKFKKIERAAQQLASL